MLGSKSPHIPVVIQDARFIATIFVPRESIFCEQYPDIVSEKCFPLVQILTIENRSLDGGGYSELEVEVMATDIDLEQGH